MVCYNEQKKIDQLKRLFFILCYLQSIMTIIGLFFILIININTTLSLLLCSIWLIAMVILSKHHNNTLKSIELHKITHNVKSFNNIKPKKLYLLSAFLHFIILIQFFIFSVVYYKIILYAVTILFFLYVEFQRIKYDVDHIL